jgi:hypothetical protein
MNPYKIATLMTVLFACFILGAAPVQAQTPEETAKKEMVEKLKKDYPLKTCVVSGDEFGGDMGAPIEYLHEETGKPVRLVRFCCKGCIKSFKKDPAKYLKIIDEAAAKKHSTTMIEAAPAAG